MNLWKRVTSSKLRVNILAALLLVTVLVSGLGLAIFDIFYYTGCKIFDIFYYTGYKLGHAVGSPSLAQGDLSTTAGDPPTTILTPIFDIFYDAGYKLGHAVGSLSLAHGDLSTTTEDLPTTNGE